MEMGGTLRVSGPYLKPQHKVLKAKPMRACTELVFIAGGTGATVLLQALAVLESRSGDADTDSVNSMSSMDTDVVVAFDPDDMDTKAAQPKAKEAVRVTGIWQCRVKEEAFAGSYIDKIVRQGRLRMFYAFSGQWPEQWPELPTLWVRPQAQAPAPRKQHVHPRSIPF